LGVIFFFLYARCQPFALNSIASSHAWYCHCFNGTFGSKIIANKQSLEDHLTAIELDLLKRMLDCNPDTRITIEDLYNHEYFNDNREEKV
jgi:serine/threonine protein kinase